MLEGVSAYRAYRSLSLPTDKQFYGMSLLFYVADYLAFVEHKVNESGSGSAENSRFDSSVFDRQLENVNALAWKWEFKWNLK